MSADVHGHYEHTNLLFLLHGNVLIVVSQAAWKRSDEGLIGQLNCSADDSAAVI